MELNTSTNLTLKSNYTYDISSLSEDDIQKYSLITKDLNKHDLTTVQQYGSELSSVIASNGDTLLDTVKGNNTSEVVQLTNDLLAQLNLIDIDELNSNTKFKRILRNIPIIRNMVKSIESIMIKYDSIKDNVNKISQKISTAKIIALRDNSTLQTIFDTNLSYIEQIRELILAAKIKEKTILDELTEMNKHPEKYDAYEISDTDNFRINLQKKIVDMETTEYILTQNLLQIRATQQNNYAIAEKSDNLVNNIIPIWKNQLAINIIMNNQKNSIEAQQKITETTNKILKENAKALKTNSINVANANEESVIKLDTLKDTTNTLIETIKEVNAIHEKGEKARQEYESHLKEFVQQLENSLNN